MRLFFFFWQQFIMPENGLVDLTLQERIFELSILHPEKMALRGEDHRQTVIININKHRGYCFHKKVRRNQLVDGLHNAKMNRDLRIADEPKIYTHLQTVAS